MLSNLASTFEWTVSKTGEAALRIGMARLAWSWEIFHKRWERASEREKSEAIHWLNTVGLIPDGMFDQLEKEMGIEVEQRKWRAAAKESARVEKALMEK